MITELRALWKEAFGDSEAFMDDFFRIAYSQSRCRYIRQDGKTVCALYWFDVYCENRKMAYLYGVATLCAYRGRGIASYLIEKTCTQLRENGYSGVILVPGSQKLYDFYRSSGFFSCTMLQEHSCSGAGSTALTPLSRQEYAALRKNLLPHRGVEQEGAFLELLESQYSLFAGEDFLFCAAVKDNKAFIPEFLGNIGKLPAAIGSLGATVATVRTPGNGRSFSMYRPLDDGQPPLYFGLAMD